MAERGDDESEPRALKVNPGYADFQLARALTTSVEHGDPATRERARERAARWESILSQILTGTVDYGSRTPVTGLPAWVTLEVVTGGFATGQPLAGGPLEPHEHERLAHLAAVPRDGEKRRALNASCLTDAGLAELCDRLRSGRFEVRVPEEGALLVVAWLTEHGHIERARALLDQISPHFATLRFYPLPAQRAQRSGARVHLQSAGSTAAHLSKIQPQRQLMAQKEAIEIWAPLHDQVVALFLETFENERACRVYPERWSERALGLIDEFGVLRREHTLCGKPVRAGGHSAQLRELLGRCALRPHAFSESQRKRVEEIVAGYVAKRGRPDSTACLHARERQRASVRAPTFHSISRVVVARLEQHPPDAGLEDVAFLRAPIGDEEAVASRIPAGTPVPDTIARKVARCLEATVQELVEKGLITSGDMMAQVLPQMTSGVRAAGIADPALRTLYAAIYQAFRRRRSLLLLNLERQVQIEELPWIEAIEAFRSQDLSAREVALQTLREVTLLTLVVFPYALVPNKLLQELRALAEGAGLDVPLVDELAADIFRGRFTQKFHHAARTAADLLEGTLYTAYYGIDCAAVRALAPLGEQGSWWPALLNQDSLAQLCAERAGVRLGTGKPSINGMILEQQQILTTQNLATLIVALDLRPALSADLPDMARHCFEWICKRQQIKIDDLHAKLVMLKNTAYAWRQMIFFLALLPQAEIQRFIDWADGHLSAQSPGFQESFRPAMLGLHAASSGSREGKTFLGWSTEHWLLEG